jgi:copper transporter 1
MKAYTNGLGFIARTWQITSRGMFAGSCIGVVLLVVLLEFLRRLSKDYDRFILHQFRRKTAMTASYFRTQNTVCCAPADLNDDPTKQGSLGTVGTAGIAPTLHFRPTLVQQSIRALLHMVTFAVAYFVMLLAMYYNGYFIICIFIGAYLGAFIFSWETISIATG